jgi:osmotically inducible protein OsmC
MIRKAKAVWRGTGRAGDGNLSTDSGVLAQTPYSFRTRFESEKGTNPEELIAAAHAGCFTMALAFGLQAGGYTPTELTTEAAVTLEPEGQGFRISRSALTLRAQVPNLDEATFARMASDAEKNCPVSKVLNAAITLDAKLISSLIWLRRTDRTERRQCRIPTCLAWRCSRRFTSCVCISPFRGKCPSFWPALETRLFPSGNGTASAPSASGRPSLENPATS